MKKENNKVSGGAIILARKLIKSDIFADKPAFYLKLWIWILMKAFWTDGEYIKRGELLTSYKKLQQAGAYKVGWRVEKPTKRQIFSFCDFLRKSQRITTRKTTRGLVIKVLNYGKYQSFENYEGNTEGNKKVTDREQDRLRKNKKIIRNKPFKSKAVGDKRKNNQRLTAYQRIRKLLEKAGRATELGNSDNPKDWDKGTRLAISIEKELEAFDQNLVKAVRREMMT